MVCFKAFPVDFEIICALAKSLLNKLKIVPEGWKILRKSSSSDQGFLIK